MGGREDGLQSRSIALSRPCSGASKGMELHQKDQSASRLVELDALRGLAALAVVMYHYTTFYGQQIGHVQPMQLGFAAGNYGVHLFFLISGFVIFMTLERTGSVRSFLVSRFSRLYPGYWAALMVTAAVVYSIGLPVQRLDGHDLALNTTMAQQILGAEHLDGSYWTLQVELFFYIQMMFWMLLLRLRHIHLVIAGWLLMAVVYNYTVQHDWHFSYLVREVLVLRYIPFFAMGILFYRLYSQRAETRLNLGMIGLCLIAVASARQEVITLVALVCCAIFGLFVTGRLGWLRGRVFAYLGAVSYSLYLLHQAIGIALIHRIEHVGLPSSLAVLMTLAIVLALATVLAYGVERPATRWIRRRWLVPAAVEG